MSVRRPAIAIAAAIVAAVSGHYADRQLDKPKAETAIKSQLQRDLRAKSGDESVTVQSVKCTTRHVRDTNCVAHVSDSTGMTLDIHIAGDWNPDTHTLRWHTVS